CAMRGYDVGYFDVW
nr:immunoglobulin heavy chain junction region [Mus musculus]